MVKIKEKYIFDLMNLFRLPAAAKGLLTAKCVHLLPPIGRQRLAGGAALLLQQHADGGGDSPSPRLRRIKKLWFKIPTLPVGNNQFVVISRWFSPGVGDFKNILIATIGILLLFSCDSKDLRDASIVNNSVLKPDANWQLFIDDYWIAGSSDVRRTLHQPLKHPVNPLIKGDAPWSQNPYCYGTVIYDVEDSVFKIWYQSYNYGQPLEDRTPVLYATSEDGIKWTKPNLGLVAYHGSKENNIILTNYGYHDLYAPSVIKDTKDADPSRRYKMIWWDFPLGSEGYQDDGMCVAFSPDGIHWNKYPGNPVLHALKKERSISDVMSVMYDRNAGKYVVFTKGWADPWPAFRQVVRTESVDFIHWSEPEVVITHKHDVHDPQSYGMTVAQIGNVYIGMLHVYKNPGDESIDVQLTVSHDNRHWSRVAGQEVFIPNGAPGSWDAGMIFTAPLFNHNGKTLIYYGGFSGPHNTENGKNHAGIGLATLRYNGFVSLDAGQNPGMVLTNPMRGIEGQLFVNADAGSGALRVEIIDDIKGKPIPGYTADECVPVTGDGIAQPVRWRSNKELPGTKQAIRIRFLLKNTSLFGFYAGQKVDRSFVE